MKWPSGFSSAGIGCGIKSDGSLDLGLLSADGPVAWAGTFTQNGAAAAPVHWSRSLLGGPVRAVIVNSGNANACTGAAGETAVRDAAAAAGAALGCPPDQVLVASTGPIGVRLPIERITSAADRLVAGLSPAIDDFATAILTTDTGMKTAVHDEGQASFVGVAKGAAMCAPNMATMLAFVATDADVEPERLQSVLSGAVVKSFNRISIDGCESTNDSVFLFASGRGPSLPDDRLEEAVGSVCAALAYQIARDAEGGGRLMRIQVSGAVDEATAASLGRAVADSVLWRCAVHGADPNWGRILSALGTVDRMLDISNVTVSIGSELVFDRGEPAPSLRNAQKEMSVDELTIECRVGSGSGRAEILSSDTSPEYVLLNAEGTS